MSAKGIFVVHPELLTQVLQIIHRVIATHLIKQVGVKRKDAATAQSPACCASAQDQNCGLGCT